MQSDNCGFVLHTKGKKIKLGIWAADELTEREKSQCLNMCLFVFNIKMTFLDKIVTHNEKWIYSKDLKLRKLWLDPGKPSTTQPK